MTRKISWLVMTVLALAVALYAAGSLVTPIVRGPFLQDLFDSAPTAISFHLFGGFIAIGVGAFQLNSRLRAKYLSWHQWGGRLYLAGVMTGGTAGMVLAVNSTGGLVAHFGFLGMATCWIGTTLVAYRHMARGNFATHGDWMIRSYSVTLAAVTLRLYLPIGGMAGVDFVSAYQVISWFAWVPNLLIVEWLVLPRRAAARLTQT